MRWCYLLLLALPVVIGGNNVRGGGDFLPVFAAGLSFAMMSIGSLEATIFVRGLFRRQRASVAAFDGLTHHAA